MFRKRKITDEMFEEALEELRSEKESFQNDLDCLKNDITTMKQTLKSSNALMICNLTSLQRDLSTQKSMYTKLHSKTLKLLNSRRKAERVVDKLESDLKNSKQICQMHLTFVEEVENELDAAEATVLHLRQEIEDKEEDCENLKMRLKAVDESTVCSLQDDSANLKAIKKIISKRRKLLDDVNSMWKDIYECVEEPLSEEGLCIVCKSKHSKLAYSCGHLCVCEECVLSTAKQCPYCRTRSNSFRIYTI